MCLIFVYFFSSEPKMWGKSPFWGVSEEYDPDWLLTDEQKELRNNLIELCRTKIRPHAVSTNRKFNIFLPFFFLKIHMFICKTFDKF